MDAGEARARFAAARVARLATVRGDGSPHLVPIVFAVDGDTVYSAVDAKPKRTPRLARLRHVVADPAVGLLVDHYEEDWSALWWVRADGRGRVLAAASGGPDEAAAAETRRALGLLASRYPQQRVVGDVLAVDVRRWTGWAASADPDDAGGR